MDLEGTQIAIVSPAADPGGPPSGNRVTSLRWAEHLAALGARVRVIHRWEEGEDDALIALHATKTLDSAQRFLARRPGAPLVVGLAGTDVYGDLAGSPAALELLGRAARIVALQPKAAERLPAELRPRVRTVLQSAAPPPRRAPRDDRFEALVLANLRAVKAPLLAARAARDLPPTSRVAVVHAGAAIDPALGAEARAETEANPRYTWLGELPHREALERLCGARLLLLTSRDEGGANSLSEALAAGVPVLATRIPGTTGMLGDDHPGLFPVDDTAGLTALLARAEEDATFLAELEAASADLAPRYTPARERSAWARLFAELTAAGLR